MTFSIAGRCAKTGMFGIAVSSSSPAVAARCAHVRAGVGAVSTQNVTDPRLGPAGLDALARGLSAAETLDILQAQAGATAPYRQLVVVDVDGRAAAFSGSACLGLHGQCIGPDVAAAGNLLATPHVPEVMAASFAADSAAHIGERLLGALEAGLAAGGEAGPVRSAGLLVADDQAWSLVDLRVDWSDRPVAALRELWVLWRPQMHDYVVRGLDPASAPAFGTPDGR